MNIENFISDAVRRSVEALYGTLDGEQLQIQKTRKEFEGDYTLVTFPLLRRSRKSPEATATEIGGYMTAQRPRNQVFQCHQGFPEPRRSTALSGRRVLTRSLPMPISGRPRPPGRTVMIEYSSPNTNKPLHLGHIRNNLLGYSVAQILQVPTAITSSRSTWSTTAASTSASRCWRGSATADGETPASSGMKGDHLVGKYYVEFDRHYKAQVKELTALGQCRRRRRRRTGAADARSAGDAAHAGRPAIPRSTRLWEMMNGWVYDGFDVTYKALGVDFDKVYYESQTYLLGKEHRRRRGSDMGDFLPPSRTVRSGSTSRPTAWIEKLLLRGDGTSVYMTQDLGTAYRRFEENKLDDMIYVVGNEQNYHFQVLEAGAQESWAMPTGATISRTSPTAWWNCPRAR